MHRKLPLKIAAGAGALVLAGTMVAAASDAPPEAADGGLTTAFERSGVEVPVRSGGAPAPDDASTDEEAEALETSDDAVSTDGEGDGGEVGAQDAGDHGAAVSDLASSKDPETPGREHGEAVSTLAQQNGQGGERSASAREGQDSQTEGSSTEETVADDDLDDDSED